MIIMIMMMMMVMMIIIIIICDFSTRTIKFNHKIKYNGCTLNDVPTCRHRE